MEKREYLVVEEVNDIVALINLTSRLETMLDTWGKKAMLNTDQAKRLRISATNIGKAVNSILDNLSEKERGRVVGKIEDCEYLIKDKKFIELLHSTMRKDHETYLKYVEDMKDLGSELMYYSCKNCKECGDNCLWHDIFKHNNFFESGENLPNCCYAYNSVYVNEGLRRITNVVKVTKGGNSYEHRRKQGTHKKDTAKSSKTKGIRT